VLRPWSVVGRRLQFLEGLLMTSPSSRCLPADARHVATACTMLKAQALLPAATVLCARVDLSLGTQTCACQSQGNVCTSRCCSRMLMAARWMLQRPRSCSTTDGKSGSYLFKHRGGILKSQVQAVVRTSLPISPPATSRRQPALQQSPHLRSAWTQELCMM
jgi:hypothetical protein